jgi:polyphosphate kinase
MAKPRTKKRVPAQKRTQKAPPPLLNDPQRFINRELSWLAFNTRVLEEAENANHPVLEQLRFLSISASNLDEFYMVRVAGLHEQVKAGVSIVSQDGLTPAEQLKRIHSAATQLIDRQQQRWRKLRAQMRTAGVSVLDPEELTEDELAFLKPLFMA